MNMEELNDESIMPFGIHKGKPMIDVPPTHLLSLKKKYDERIKKAKRGKKIFTNQEALVYDYIIDMEQALLLEISLKKKKKEGILVYSPDINYTDDLVR